MKYQALGNTGLYVSQLTLGTMTFNQEGGPLSAMMGATGQELATQMVDMAIDAGINLFDTANMYGMGESEIMLGKALAERRKDVLIATKVFFPSGTNHNDLGLSRLAIMREIENSLSRLRTDWIDLYQVHSFDETTPLEETLRALDDLVRQGKVRYIGLSNFAAWQIAMADGLAKQLGTEQFCSVQAYYSLVGRELEREIIPTTQGLCLGILVWSPLAGGFLSGKYTGESETDGRRKKFDFPPINKERGFMIVDTIREIAKSHNVSVAQIALSWLLHQEGVTSVIVGARRQEQLADNLKCVDIELSQDEIVQLDEVSRIAPEYPQWMFRQLQRGVDMMKEISS